MKVRIEDLHKTNTLLQSRLDELEANSLLHDLDQQKSRVEELRRENVTLVVEQQQSETKAKQEEHLRLRIAQDCEELVKSNITLKCELEEVQRRMRKVILL
jgi:YesN/AraC family two-component response regulator